MATVVGAPVQTPAAVLGTFAETPLPEEVAAATESRKISDEMFIARLV
jgi:hypothetical protein